MNQQVYVANPPFKANEPKLKVFFSKTGEAMFVKMVGDRQTCRLKDIAFLERSTQWKARRAVSMLNLTDFIGKNLLVKEATEKRGFLDR